MSRKNPHLLKSASLFALFCLSYLPLFFLLTVKVVITNQTYLHFAGFTLNAFILMIQKFGFVIIMTVLGIYAGIGTMITLSNIRAKRSNANPVKLKSIKPKNEEALSYLATYVIPLLIQGDTGLFEYVTFTVLFIIYYKLYSTSSLILINPILNMKYGLYDVEYIVGNEIKSALIISEHKWLDEGEELKVIKLSHRLYFGF
jgi:hypothetical protein